MNNMHEVIENPFKPSAGHKPPYLAGRKKEEDDFRKLLIQKTVLENLVLTGLRGVGKTVLLDNAFKGIAIASGWLWVGSDLSEAASVSDENMAIRIITDLAAITSDWVFHSRDIESSIGFSSKREKQEIRLTFEVLSGIYRQTPGIASDKLKNVLETVWKCASGNKKNGIIFAYDEAQNLSDHKAKDQYPLSLLLDVFQSIQKKDIPFMLLLTGLPILFPKLVESRTFAERMFSVITLHKLNKHDSYDAIKKPIEDKNCPIKFDDATVETIYKMSGGYPFFIQFICKEVFDVWIQKFKTGEKPSVAIGEIVKKLDANFFAGRWSRATDRQRDLLKVAASLPNAEEEFMVQEIAEKSKEILKKSFSPSQINQMLVSLCAAGLVYKNRYGKYSFAVPLFSGFIMRQ